MADTKRTRAAAQRIETERRNFRSLITANPNYFGNFPATELPVVKKIATNTNYEEMISVGYHPRARQLHATVDIKRTGGYGGGLCTDGSFEYVRFYVDHGAGWVDAGMAATRVHDIPAGEDCEGDAHHPLTYAVTVPYAPHRRWCFFPQLPRIRAILSWNVAPPAGQPEWIPVYGNRRECNIQIGKSPFVIQFLDDLVAKFDVPLEAVETVKPFLPPIDPDPPEFGGLVPEPPVPNPPAPLTTAQLAERYALATRAKHQRFAVEPSRFAFAEVQALTAASALDLDAVATLKGVFEPADIDISDLVAEIDDTTGNISYEELVDVGLDTNRERLVATYHVKKPSGFSGGLCTAGSLEHVAFWADWDGDCNWEYLDTVSARAYDFEERFEELPDGLCYSVSLPVDIERFKRHCSEPNIARVRAVLSWSTPPSTVDPDRVPTWGNRLDAHVQVPVRVGAAGTLTRIGGINIAEISDLTGMAAPTATLMPIGVPVDSGGHPAPFGGRLLIVGPEVPGKRYRLHVVDSGGSTTLMSTIKVGDGASPTLHSPDPNGWYDYLSHGDNPDRLLGYFDSSGDELVRVDLEIEGIGVVDSQRVRLDNTRPEVSISITEPVTDCGKVPPGVLLKGRVHATDVHMLRWNVVIDGGPSGFGPDPVTSGGSGTTNTPPGGVEWTYQTAAAMPPCGYVVRVTATDRTILNSGLGHWRRPTDVGFCVED